MSKAYTSVFNLEKDDVNEFYDVMVQSRNMDKTEAALLDLSKVFTAGGTATAITIVVPSLYAYRDGLKLTIVASANNYGAATTIKANTLSVVPLYKPGTTMPPSLTEGKAYEIWYNLAGNCFFLKASAEGTAQAHHVLAPYTISNDDDIGVVGNMVDRSGDHASLSSLVSANTLKLIPPEGYFDGVDDAVTITDANFASSNIKVGINMFGIDGALTPRLGDLINANNYNAVLSIGDGNKYPFEGATPSERGYYEFVVSTNKITRVHKTKTGTVISSIDILTGTWSASEMGVRCYDRDRIAISKGFSTPRGVYNWNGTLLFGSNSALWGSVSILSNGNTIRVVGSGSDGLAMYDSNGNYVSYITPKLPYAPTGGSPWFYFRKIANDVFVFKGQQNMYHIIIGSSTLYNDLDYFSNYAY